MSDASTGSGATDKSQSDVIAFLEDPVTFGGAPVERIDTHISHIFMAGDRVLKLKRAIKFRFLDFTSLAMREQACRREVEVNRRNAPHIYLGILAVTVAGSGYELNGPGKVADWVVEMNRFDQAGILSHVILDGRDRPDLMPRLAEKIADSQKAGAIRPDLGGADAMLRTFHDLIKTIEETAVDRSQAALTKKLQHKITTELVRNRQLLDTRQRHGFVRACHGDLHLENICESGGEPFLFDAIEFSDEISCIDVLYDLAYPLMDLLFLDRSDLANLLLSRYLEISRDYSGLRLLPAFMAIRGMIRAMVHLVSAEGGRYSAEELKRGPAYMEIAAKCMGSQPARLYAIGGLSGSGKSTIARNVAPHLHNGPGAVVIRSDAIRKRLFGKEPEIRLPPEAYTEAITANVYAAMIKDATRALKAGWSVVLDATFLDADARQRVEALATRIDVPFVGVWLDAPLEVLAKRVTVRQHDASDATAEVVKAQMAADIGRMNWHRVDASGGIDDITKSAIEVMR